MRQKTVALLVASVIVSHAGMVRAARYKVTIDSDPKGAALYLEAKEGGVIGYTPHTLRLQPGKYTIILEKDGYAPVSRTIQVGKRSSKISIAMVKRPSTAKLTIEPASGSDVAGGTIKVNGKEVGKVPLTVTLQPGRYLVEVEKEGYSTYNKWFEFKAGDRKSIVVNLTSKAPTSGSLLVATNIVGCEVFVDGRKVDDTAPALVEGLSPGRHIVEARAAGYLPQRQEATVEPGKTLKITLTLAPDKQTVAKTSGTLQVLSNHKDVDVLVDGVSRGKAPAKVEGLPEGTHVVEAQKDGMISAEKTIDIKAGQLLTIKLDLKEKPIQRRTGSIRVVSTVLGAMIFIDGKYVGKTPMIRHEFDPGPHFVTVRKKGYKERVTTIEVKANQISQVEANLEKLPKSEDPSKMVKTKVSADEPDRLQGISSHAAAAVRPGFFTADLSGGWPYLFEGRLTTGFYAGDVIGMDGGIEMRTFGAISEIGLHTKLRLLRREMFSVGLFFALGGGGGPKSRNTFYTNFGGIGSMHFKNRVIFSARAFFNFYTDRVCPSSQDPDEMTACTAPPTGVGRDKVRDRLGGVRFFLSAILEVVIIKNLNAFVIFEGVPFQGDRHLYTDPFASLMATTDPGTYFRLGITLKR